MGAVVRDEAGRLLLVRRANPPARGAWSLPGGRVEPGESEEEAVRREVLEETGLLVRPQRVAGVVERDAPDGSVYRIVDYVCAVTGGTAAAASDAADLCWADRADLARLTLTDGLLDALSGWGVLEP